MPIVLHLLTRESWDGFGPDEPVTNASLDTEGFIHCTDDEAVLLQVANAFYRSVPGDFVVLDVDVADLTSACVWEEPAHIVPADGSTPPEPFAPQFPHVYGPIDRAAIRRTRAVHRSDDGAFTGYAD